MDVSTLRADIKSWERLFRQQHGRDPTVQEIKDLPDIAEKYKLYKKLSKQSQPASRPESAREQPRPSTSSTLLSTSKSKARPVKLDPPAVTSNPFSPVKNKHGRPRPASPDQSVLPIPSLLASASRANPFKTPTKAKPPREPRRAPEPPIQELEEDPFPLIVQPNKANSPQRTLSPLHHHTPQRNEPASYTDTTEHPPSAASSSNALPPRDKNAVTRARKRLRGEPVSPSPVKEKRLRLADRLPVQPALRFDTVDLSDDDEPVRRGEPFIEDTPAKPPAGKKQFKVLFDEAAPSAVQPAPAAIPRAKEPSLTRSKSANGKGLFAFGFAASKENGLKRSKSRALSPCSEHSDDEMDWDAATSSKGPSAKLKAPDFSPAASAKFAPPKPVKNGAKVPRALLPGKDDLWSAGKSASESAPTKSRKRSSSPPPDHRSQTTPRQTLTALPLLPPSPPADSQQPKYIDKGKGRALARKKSKMLAGDDEESEEEPEEEDLKVKELPWKWNRHRSQGQDILASEGPEPEPDSEPDFELAHVPAASHLEEDATGQSEEKFEVHLPDNLRRVLALSPPPHIAPELEDEDKLVQGLLYGRRAHYDASHGGEIWGAGEFSSESEDGLELPGAKGRKARGEQSEDEWEGEPVPWEAAEL